MNFLTVLLLGLFLQVKLNSAELFDNYHLKKIIELFLFMGGNFEYKSGTSNQNNRIYKKENLNNNSNSLYLYFHGNCEFIDEIYSPPLINYNSDYVIYEYPGYFYTNCEYKKSNIENFIKYSREIAEDIKKTNKKEIIIVSWSLGVWVSLVVLNYLKEYIIKNNVKVKCVLINGFYDLYQFIEEFGWINKNEGLLFFIYDILIKKILKILIGKNKNYVMSNFNLIKSLLDISDVKYLKQTSIGHQSIFYNQEDKMKIEMFLNSNTNKNINLLITSAIFDPITGKGMYKIYRNLLSKKLIN